MSIFWIIVIFIAVAFVIGVGFGFFRGYTDGQEDTLNEITINHDCTIVCGHNKTTEHVA